MKNLLTLIICLLIAPHTLAEDIKIPVGSQTPELQNIARPIMGMTKSHVKTRFGDPLKENAAKGQPPISSWEYPDFVVYFENEHVIDSVLKPKHHENKEIIVEKTDVMSEDELKTK